MTGPHRSRSLICSGPTRLKASTSRTTVSTSTPASPAVISRCSGANSNAASFQAAAYSGKGNGAAARQWLDWEREAAGRRLDEIGAPALEPLRAACRSDDPEVARRARDLVARIGRRLANEQALAPTVVIAHEGLMNSPGHRANILNPRFRRVGIGVADGGMHGKMFTQNFAD